MELTQKDYDDRSARVVEGTADDEDHRLVKLYESEGYERQAKDRLEDTDHTPEDEREGDKEGEKPSAGNSSPRSDETTPSSTTRTDENPPSPVHTTENRSKKDRKDNSTAERAAGSGKV